MAIAITNNLIISGNATFSGTSGFTTLNYSQAVPGSVVTLNSGVTYTVNGQLTITGNRVGIPNPNLWRTINWDSLVPLTPLVTVAYVE
jgi:hypothetical protein